MQEQLSRMGAVVKAAAWRLFYRQPRHECPQMLGTWAGRFDHYRERCPKCGANVFWIGEEIDTKVRVENGKTVVLNIFRDEIHTVICDGCGEALNLPGEGDDE